MQRCPDCGASVEEGEMYCYDCGSYLQSGEYDARTGQGSQNRQHDSGWDDPSAQSGWDESGQQTGRQQRGNQWDAPAGQARQQQTGRQRQGGGQRQAGRQRGARQGRARRGVGRRDPGPRIEDGKLDYAIKLPVSRDYNAIGLGAVLNFASFLIVPIFTLMGYTHRLTGAAARGESVQPDFDDLGELTKVGFVYSLLLLGLGLVGVGGPLAISAYAGGALGSAAGAVALGLFLAVSYVGPAMLTLYPATGKLSASFAPGQIAGFAFTSKYLVSYLLFAAVVIGLSLAWMVAALFMIVMLFGIFLLIPLNYLFNTYLLYSTGAFWGATYYQTADERAHGHQQSAFGTDRQRDDQYDTGADHQRNDQYDDGW
jgi:hypothetical protein